MTDAAYNNISFQEEDDSGKNNLESSVMTKILHVLNWSILIELYFSSKVKLLMEILFKNSSA